MINKYCKMDGSDKLCIPTPWAKFPSPYLVDLSGPLWVRFSKNRCYKKLIYFKCPSWYFIESSIRWTRTFHQVWTWKVCPRGWNPKWARMVHFTLLLKDIILKIALFFFIRSISLEQKPEI